MKYRSTLFTTFIALMLAACSLTLAEDVTPPPGAVQQVQPTHSPVYPASALDLTTGAAIYAEKCAACHGERGLGDGPQAEQLPVPVAALGSPDVARGASPADWFLTVTLGNINNYMPPFASLNDQERWDVVAYALSLNVTAGQLERGKSLFEELCADCPLTYFKNQQSMATLSTTDLVALLSSGGEGIPAIGSSLPAEDQLALAAYLRTLTYAPTTTPSPTVEAPVVVTPSNETPSGDLTPTEGTPQSETTPEPVPEEGVGPVSGKVSNGSGSPLPPGLTVTLHGLDHGVNASTAPVESINVSAAVDADGNYHFERVEIPEGRIFYTEVTYEGVLFQSDPVIVEAGLNEIVLSDLTIYDSTTETSALVTEDLFIFSEFNADGTVRIFEQFYISNQSNRAVLVETDGNSIPILPMPAGLPDLAFQPTQDSAPLLSTDTGFAIPPSTQTYGLIAFYTLPYEKVLDLELPFALPVASISVVVPEGIRVESESLTDEGVREMQPGARFQIYSGNTLEAGQTLDMTFTGKVKSASSTSLVGDNTPLLVGIGAFGVALILAGIWLYLRDRNAEGDEFEGEEPENGFETSEDVMDAIIALDDLHRAGKIPDEAYRARRAELKEQLKDLA